MFSVPFITDSAVCLPFVKRLEGTSGSMDWLAALEDTGQVLLQDGRGTQAYEQGQRKGDDYQIVQLPNGGGEIWDYVEWQKQVEDR